MINKYRKKPIEIEAIQYTGENAKEVINFVNSNIKVEDVDLIINTLEGDMTISNGDFVIKGVNGEFYPCKPDIFEKTYEKVK